MKDLLDLKVDTKTLKVNSREGDRREFKVLFDRNALWKYCKTMVSFANRDGGVLVFGVKDRPRELVGLTGNNPDELVFAHFLKEYFEPEIRFTLDTLKIAGKNLFYVLIESSPNKPVICKKRKVEKNKEVGKTDKELLREGAIYYRYSSSTEEIKYPELTKILEEKVQKVFHSMVDNITLLNKVGYDRAAIVDAADLSGNDKTTSVYITTETAKNINWIQKGRFSETEDQSEKAYYVTREIEVKHGVEISNPVPTDPGLTHTLTQTALRQAISLSGNHLDAVLWKLGLLNNPKYHLSGQHGKNKWHKFTEATKDKVLEAYPLDLTGRLNKVKDVVNEYLQSQRN